MIDFVQRLKQRKLVQWAVAYVAAAWVLLQVLGLAQDSYGWPRGVMQLAFGVLALGFVVTLVLAWYHGDRGAQRASGTELLLIALVLAVGGGLLWHFERGGPSAGAAAPALATRHGSASAAGVQQATASAPPATNTLLSPAASVPAKSVAVLPFKNLSGDPRQAYFSDGITEEILNALAQIPDLKVTARTSAFAFSSTNEDPRKIGATLGVANLLEGSVQKSGDEVRINVQLIDARTGYQRWSEKYDRKLTNIFTIEDEISKAIADKLRVQLSGGGQPLVRSQTDDAQAHALYLQGIAKIAQRGPALKDAVAFFARSTARDPDYAMAWAGLSQAYELLPWYNLGDWRGSLVKAESAARRALALDPQLGEAHAALANVLRDRLDFAGADKEYRQALALNPGSSEIRNQYGQLLGAVGEFDDALKQTRIAVALDPLASDPRYVLGWLLISMHHNIDGIAELEKVVTQVPAFTPAYVVLIIGYLNTRNYAKAEQAGRTVAARTGNNPVVIVALVRAVADPSLRPDALKLVGSGMTGDVSQREMEQAFWYGQLGAHDKAIASLQHWADDSKPGEVFKDMFYLWSSAFDPIRNDPRFKAVLKKLGLPYTPSVGASK